MHTHGGSTEVLITVVSTGITVIDLCFTGPESSAQLRQLPGTAGEWPGCHDLPQQQDIQECGHLAPI